MPTREYNQYGLGGILNRVRGGGFLLFVCLHNVTEISKRRFSKTTVFSFTEHLY